MFENIAYVSDGTPLRQLCVKHFIHAMFHHFPCNFAAGWKLILSGCDTQVVPEELFARIIARFDVFDVVLNEHYAVKIAQQLQMSSMSLSSEQAGFGGNLIFPIIDVYFILRFSLHILIWI